jgi:hypothetical protein
MSRSKTAAPVRKPTRPVLISRTGYSAAHRAIEVMSRANGFISKSKKCAANGDIGEMRAAINPTIVIGATNGAATMLAIIDIREM